jgi:hypothetical protein
LLHPPKFKILKIKILTGDKNSIHIEAESDDTLIGGMLQLLRLDVTADGDVVDGNDVVDDERQTPTEISEFRQVEKELGVQEQRNR